MTKESYNFGVDTEAKLYTETSRMTEKRFELSKSDIKDFRIYDYGKEDAYFIGCDEHTGICLISLLNQLNEENEQLKKELDQFYLLIGRGDWSGLVDLIKGDVE